MREADVPTPPELEETFDCWRLVVAEQVVSLAELQRDWTLEDVADAIDMLAYMAATQRAEKGARAVPRTQDVPEVAAMAGIRPGQIRQARRRR